MAELISSFDIKKGMVYKFENELYECIEFKYISPGLFSRMKQRIKIVSKNLKKGVLVEQTCIHSDYIEPIIPKENKMTFMYDDSENLFFMDTDTFDMIDVPISTFEWEKNFLTPDLTVSCSVYDNEVIRITLPDSVPLTLTDCDEIDSSNPSKNAVCETGLKIKVPIFLNVGEQIIVSTSDGTYIGRA